MMETKRESTLHLSSYQIAAILAFFALNLTVYLIRIDSVWRFGALFSPTAVESPMIESIWKCMHGKPLYEWPFTFPFSLSLYNYLFYRLYALVLALSGIWDEGILTWGRQFTLVFALIGAVAQWRLVRSLLNLRGAASALSLCFALGLWLCTSLVKYWALVIRPDMAAAAVVMVALWVIARQPRFCFTYAGILLYVAWSFKQSEVLAFAGICLWLLLSKMWREVAIMVAVFAALVIATLFMGGTEYLFSILAAPQMVKGFSLDFPWLLHALGSGLTAIFLNLYWVVAPFVLIAASGGARRFGSALRMLLAVFIVAMIAGLAGMGKVGGTSNYLFEAFIAGSTMLQIVVFFAPGNVVTSLVLFGCLQPALQIAGVAIGYHQPGKRDTVQIANDEEYAAAVALRDRLATMKKPMFTTLGPFQLPWISSTSDAPALVIDPNFQNAAQSRELNGGIDGMLQRGEIPTVMLAPRDLDYLKSLSPNYRKVDEFTLQGVIYSIYTYNAGASTSPYQ